MPPKELPEAGGGEPKPKKRSRFKIIMLIGSLLLVLGAGGGAGYWWLFMRPDATGFGGLFSSEEAPAAVAAPTTAAPAGGEKAASSSSSGSGSPKAVLRPVPLPSLTVNLADSPGNRYLKIGMEVEVSAADAVQELQNQTARVRDSIILLLSSKTVAELTSPEGKVLLKNEVVARLNQILGAARVVRIYFTDFVIQ